MKTPTMLLAGCLALLGAAGRAAAASDGGTAQFVPWSGYWWPVKEGRMLGPLTKYDRITGSKAASWEAWYRPPGTGGRWWGYCHAWSAASLLEAEPRSWRSVPIPGGSVTLGVGDQKGLLTIAHDNDPAHIYGTRYAGKLGDDFHDIYPDVLWKYLRLYVKQQGVPLIIDASPGTQVWNYPVYSYQVKYQPADGGKYQAWMKLLMADDAVSPGFVGTKVKAKAYLFTFKAQGGAVVAGSGRWAGVSVKDHPDFAWYPLFPRPRNPYVSYDRVKQLVPVGQREPGDPAARSGPQEKPAAREVEDAVAGRAIPVSALELAAVLADRGPFAFRLDLAVTPGAGGPAAVGRPYTVRGTSARDGYLYLFHVASDGEVRLLYPVPGQDNRVTKGRTFTLGSTGRLVFPGPAGKQRVRGLVTTRPLLLGQLEPPGAEGQRFLWEPAERALVQDILREAYAGRLAPHQLERDTGVDPRELLKEFAQQEVVVEVVPPR